MKRIIYVLLFFSSCVYSNKDKVIDQNITVQDEKNIVVEESKKNDSILPKERFISTDVMPSDSLKILIKRVKDGNIEAYEELSYQYFIGGKTDELYPYAKYMADKYSVKSAYYDVYASIRRRNVKRSTTNNKVKDLMILDRCSKEEIQIALDYLIKAYQKGSIESRWNIAAYYKKGIYFPKDCRQGES